MSVFFFNKSMYKILSLTHREGLKKEVILKWIWSMKEIIRGKAFEVQEKPYKSTEKNFRGILVILLCRDKCEEMADKQTGWITETLTYHAKESFIQICILLEPSYWDPEAQSTIS